MNDDELGNVGAWRDEDPFPNGQPMFRVFRRNGLIDAPSPGEPAILSHYSDGQIAMRGFFVAGRPLQMVWYDHDGLVVCIEEPDPITGERVAVFERGKSPQPAPAADSSPAPVLRLVTPPDDSPEIGA